MYIQCQILWSDEPQFQASCLKESRHCSSHAEYYVLKVKCGGSSLMLWDCFSGLRDSSEWKKSSKHQNIEMKTQSRAFRTSDGQNIYFPTGQWPLTHSKSGLYTMLWMSLSGPATAWTWTQTTISGETWKCVSDPSNLTELERWRGEETIADNCQMLRSKACRIKQKRLEAVKVLQLNI